MEKLTKDEWRVLEWLSREDGSLFGECHGPALDRLVELGLAEIGPDPAGKGLMYRSVGVTDYGWEFLTDMREAQSDAAELASMSWGD